MLYQQIYFGNCALKRAIRTGLIYVHAEQRTDDVLRGDLSVSSQMTAGATSSSSSRMSSESCVTESSGSESTDNSATTTSTATSSDSGLMSAATTSNRTSVSMAMTRAVRSVLTIVSVTEMK